MLDKLSGIVKKVGDELLQWRNAGIFEGEWQGSQYKAKVDSMAQDILSKGLKEIEPHTLVISEEDNDCSALKWKPNRYWLIDPIDGTASFTHGFPGFVTQVALLVNQRPVISAVFAPLFEMMYLAERNKGAYCNGKKMALNPKNKPCCLVDNYPEPKGIAQAVFNGLGLKEYVECGSIGLKICKVADGTADIFVKGVTVRTWDLAPGHLVLEEAGGTLADKNGRAIKYGEGYEIDGVIAAADKVTVKRLSKIIKKPD